MELKKNKAVFLVGVIADQEVLDTIILSETAKVSLGLKDLEKLYTCFSLIDYYSEEVESLFSPNIGKVTLKKCVTYYSWDAHVYGDGVVFRITLKHLENEKVEIMMIARSHIELALKMLS